MPRRESRGVIVTLSRDYWLWLSSAVGSEFGSNVMAFAIVWTATGLGGQTAGLVSTATVLLRSVLLIPGGMAGDRFGVREVMIACDTVMLVSTAVLTAWFAIRGPSTYSLLIVGCLLGLVSAFYLPASGVFPRYFANEPDVGRVMATTSSGLQIARIAGPAAGGVLIALLGLTWLTALNAASFVLILFVLVRVRPRNEIKAAGATDRVTLRDAVRTLASSGQVRVIGPLLATVAAVVAAAGLATVLLFPLVCRAHGWGARTAGAVEAVFMISALGVGGTVAARGTMSRSSVPLVAGPIVVAVGLIVVSLANVRWIVCLGAGLTAVGLVAFTTHALPVFLAASPDGAKVRLQSVLGLVQAVPVLILSSVYGAIAQHAGVPWALTFGAGWALVASAIMIIWRPWAVTIVRPVSLGTVEAAGEVQS